MRLINVEEVLPRMRSEWQRLVDSGCLKEAHGYYAAIKLVEDFTPTIKNPDDTEGDEYED